MPNGLKQKVLTKLQCGYEAFSDNIFRGGKLDRWPLTTRQVPGNYVTF